jgi:hypothetical protein
MEGTETIGSTTTGPATFAEAFAADASSASSPVSESAAAPSGADTTALPADQTTDGVTPAQGEPPKERWADILENARTKAREEERAQYAQVEWAKSVSQQEFQQIADMARKASTEPIAYLQDFIKELQTHPTYGPQLKSLAAKALSQRTAPQGPDLTPLQVQMEDGRTVPLYSADQIAALKSQWLAEAEQKFQPYTKTLEDLQAERVHAQKAQEQERFVSTTYADLVTWPGMDDQANRKAVAEELARNVKTDDPRDISLALNAAYRKVVLPKLASKSESSVLENLQRKAAAATSINPGSAASTSPRPVKSFSDLPPEAWR